MITKKDDSLLHLVMWALGAEDFFVRVELDDEEFISRKFCTFSMRGDIRNMIVQEIVYDVDSESFMFSRDSIKGDELTMILRKDCFMIFNAGKLRAEIKSNSKNVTKFNDEWFVIDMSFVSGLVKVIKYEER